MVNSNPKSGEILGRISSERIVNIKWKDKHEVPALSTKHLDTMFPKPSRRHSDRKKPQRIIEHNEC